MSPASHLSGRNGEPAGSGRDFAFSLNGGVEAASAARRAVLAGDGAVPAFIRDDVLLLVTELVTNAVRHGAVGPDRSLRVELKRRPRQVRVEVADPGPGFTAVPTRLKGKESNGWGLLLVDRIAERWGVKRRASGTCVWFEIRFAE
jgi:serine/threonine-protein kinase RsbW